MLTSRGAVEVISTRDKLSNEAHQEMSAYYRANGKSQVIELDSHRSSTLLAELEKECARKVLD